MSVTYQASVFVGIPLQPEWTDFIEKRTVTKVLCDHPEAEPSPVKFCPVCGTKSSARINKEIREFPLPTVAHLDPFIDMDVEVGEKAGWMDDWCREAGYGYARIGDLEIRNLNDREARSTYLVLGRGYCKQGTMAAHVVQRWEVPQWQEPSIPHRTSSLLLALEGVR